MPCCVKSLLFLKAKTYELFALALDFNQNENDIPRGYTDIGLIVKLDTELIRNEPVPNW